MIRSCTVSNVVIRDTRTGIQVNGRCSPDSKGAFIENILFSDILMEVKRPPAVCSDVRGVHDQEIKPIRNMVFRNLDGSDAVPSARRFRSTPGDIRARPAHGLFFRAEKSCISPQTFSHRV